MSPETFHWLMAFVLPPIGGAILGSLFFLVQQIRITRASRKAKQASRG